MRARVLPAVLLAAGVVLQAAGPAAAATPPPTLASDATGPLFTAGLLEPGVLLERCVRLSWTDAAGTVLGVSARVTGDLAPFLAVTVQPGRGGGYARCDGFAPTGPAWAGTLAALGDAHGTPAGQASLAPVSEAHGSATVRITVEVVDDNRAQAQRAGGAIAFALVGTPVTRPTDPATPTTPAVPTTPAEPTAPPTTPDPVASAPATAATATPAPDADRPAPQVATTDEAAGPTDDTTPVAADAPQPPSVGPAPRDGAVVTVPLSPDPSQVTDGGWLAETVERLLTTSTRSAEAITRAVGWTFWTLPVMFLFLLLQNRIDDRDPKLADAPAEAVPGLPFDETYDVPGIGTHVAPGGAR